jgi:glycosyltransferase involved in cell wall biosynthesis
MKRVLLTVHKFFPEHRAGTEVLTLKVAQELKRRGYEVMVVTANPPDSPPKDPASAQQGKATNDYIFEGIPVHSIEEPLRAAGYKFDYEYYHPAIGRHFSELLAKFTPHVVHSFHLQNLSASVITVSAEKGIPVICSTTDFWSVCPIVQLRKPDGKLCRGPAFAAANCLSCYTPELMPGFAEFELALNKKFPVLDAVAKEHLPDSIHSAVEKTLYGAYIGQKYPIAAAATIKRLPSLLPLLNETKAIMVPTQLMKEIFIENGVRESLLHHVPFGIDLSQLKEGQCKTLSKNLRIGFVGTIAEHKGVDLLVEAFQMLPADAPATLTIFGDLKQFPEYSEQLQKIVSSPKICFAGSFPNSELGARLAEIDVLVVPSRWYENTPLVVQSALASKTPVIATDLGGLSELIHHNKNGLLFELNNAHSLYKQLDRLLNEQGLLTQLVAGIGPERSVAQMVDDIEQIYEETCFSTDGQAYPPVHT